MVREFFGKPMRGISLHYHSQDLSLDDFITEAIEGLEGYRENMKVNARPDHTHFANKLHHMERWIESFLAWFEVEQDPDAE